MAEQNRQLYPEPIADIMNNLESRHSELERQAALRNEVVTESRMLARKRIREQCPDGIEQLNLDDDRTPINLLANGILPRFKNQLEKFRPLIEPANLDKLDIILEDLRAIDHTFGLVCATFPLCWLGQAESEFESPAYRRQRSNRLHFEFIINTHGFFIRHSEFWENFPEENQTLRTRLLESITSVLDLIEESSFFLQKPLFDIMNVDFKKYVESINRTIEEYGSVTHPLQHPEGKRLIIPLLSLSRTFINKICESTNQNFIIFRRMNAETMVLLHSPTLMYIPLNLKGLAEYVVRRPENDESIVRLLAKVISAFNICVKQLTSFLASIPPDAGLDPSMTLTASQWFSVWLQQLLLLHNLADFFRCEFPSDQYSASVDL